MYTLKMRILRNKGFQNIKADTIYSNGISSEEKYEDFKEYPGDNTKLVLSKSLNNEQTADLEIYKIEDNLISNKYSYFINKIQSDNPESQYYFSKNNEELTFELIKENGLLSVLINNYEFFESLSIEEDTTGTKRNTIEFAGFVGGTLNDAEVRIFVGSSEVTYPAIYKLNGEIITDPFEKYSNGDSISKISFEYTDTTNGTDWYYEFGTVDLGFNNDNIPELIKMTDIILHIKDYNTDNPITSPFETPADNITSDPIILRNLKIYSNVNNLVGKIKYIK